MTVNETSTRTASSDRPQTGFDSTTVLTSKELKVLELLSFGYENRDIATHFQTSGQAVKNMLRTINLKLGADNRTHAVAVCFRNGWLPLKETAGQNVSPNLRIRSDRPRSKTRCKRRRYHDGTVDSVCSNCGLVIARAWRASDLQFADRNHVCQSEERRHKVRFVMEMDTTHATPSFRRR